MSALYRVEIWKTKSATEGRWGRLIIDLDAEEPYFDTPEAASEYAKKHHCGKYRVVSGTDHGGADGLR